MKTQHIIIATACALISAAGIFLWISGSTGSDAADSMPDEHGMPAETTGNPRNAGWPSTTATNSTRNVNANSPAPSGKTGNQAVDRLVTNFQSSRELVRRGRIDDAVKQMSEDLTEMSVSNEIGSTRVAADGAIEVVPDENLVDSASAAFNELLRASPSRAADLVRDGTITSELQDFLSDEFGRASAQLLKSDPEQFIELYSGLDNDTQRFAAWELAEELVLTEGPESALQTWEQVASSVNFDIDNAVDVISVTGKHTPGG